MLRLVPRESHCSIKKRILDQCLLSKAFGYLISAGSQPAADADLSFRHAGSKPNRSHFGTAAVIRADESEIVSSDNDFGYVFTNITTTNFISDNQSLAEERRVSDG
ncbi:hypothetical protein LZ554_006185 [Drepanopeziza brunnea f. sp. 'monogermtubi']|nr:hypothetical protein LZ554_006185 [Drepanopeziza brunnea f. sp. 'monogermtubi']